MNLCASTRSGSTHILAAMIDGPSLHSREENRGSTGFGAPLGPVLVARSYAVRFPVREARWLSRWRLLGIVAGVNGAAGALAWLLIRMLR